MISVPDADVNGFLAHDPAVSNSSNKLSNTNLAITATDPTSATATATASGILGNQRAMYPLSLPRISLLPDPPSYASRCEQRQYR